jgi:hypothetical protein
MNLRAMQDSRRRVRLLAALALSLTAFGATGCGHKQGAAIPAAQANDIVGRLQEAQRRSDAHACHDLRTDTIPMLERQVAALPQNVDSNVRATLSDGVAHLKDLVQQQCAAPPATTTTPTTTTTTTTTPTQTSTSLTTTTPTTSTTTSATTATTPTRTATTPTATTPGGVTPPGPNGKGPPGQQKKHGGDKGKG